MQNKNYNSAHKWTKLMAVPLVSVFIIVLWSLFFWKSDDYIYSTGVISVFNILFFVVIYKFVAPWIAKKESVKVLIAATFMFPSLSVCIYLLLFNSGIVDYPFPFNTVKFPISFFIAIFGIISMTVFLAALSFYMMVNTFLISIDSYQLLQKSYQSEINALRLQMNPHFISNSLNNLGAIIRKKEKTAAQKYNHELIELIEEQLKYSNYDTVYLKDELSWIEYYIQVEQKRLNYNFEYKIELEDTALKELIVPPMLLQPLIENSIKHGFNPAIFEGTGLINISIKKKKKNELIIHIEDNGIGSNYQPSVIDKSRPSITTENIKKRIQLINETGKFYIAKTRNIETRGTVCIINIEINT